MISLDIEIFGGDCGQLYEDLICSSSPGTESVLPAEFHDLQVHHLGKLHYELDRRIGFVSRILASSKEDGEAQEDPGATAFLERRLEGMTKMRSRLLAFIESGGCLTTHNLTLGDLGGAVIDVGDGFVYPRPAALKAAAHLFKAMQALHGCVDPDRFVGTLSELLGGPHWSAVAFELTDALEADPGLLGRTTREVSNV
jgi:hypothetical protein